MPLDIPVYSIGSPDNIPLAIQREMNSPSTLRNPSAPPIETGDFRLPSGWTPASSAPRPPPVAPPVNVRPPPGSPKSEFDQEVDRIANFMDNYKADRIDPTLIVGSPVSGVSEGIAAYSAYGTMRRPPEFFRNETAQRAGDVLPPGAGGPAEMQIPANYRPRSETSRIARELAAEGQPGYAGNQSLSMADRLAVAMGRSSRDSKMIEDFNAIANEFGLPRRSTPADRQERASERGAWSASGSTVYNRNSGRAVQTALPEPPEQFDVRKAFVQDNDGNWWDPKTQKPVTQIQIGKWYTDQFGRRTNDRTEETRGQVVEEFAPTGNGTTFSKSTGAVNDPNWSEDQGEFVKVNTGGDSWMLGIRDPSRPGKYHWEPNISKGMIIPGPDGKPLPWGSNDKLNIDKVPIYKPRGKTATTQDPATGADNAGSRKIENKTSAATGKSKSGTTEAPEGYVHTRADGSKIVKRNGTWMPYAGG
jgi:hypothetical protein